MFSQTHGSIPTVILHINDVPCCWDQIQKLSWSTDWTRECLCTCSAWGVPLLLTFGLCGIAYVGLGILYGRTRGHTRASMSVRAHPHWNQWKEVYSLARDGMRFARGGGRARAQRAGYTPVPRAPAEREGSSSGSRKERGPGGDAKKAKRAKQDRKEGGKERTDAPRPEPQSGHSPDASCAGSSSAGSGSTGPATGKSAASGGGGRWVHVPG